MTDEERKVKAQLRYIVNSLLEGASGRLVCPLRGSSLGETTGKISRGQGENARESGVHGKEGRDEPGDTSRGIPGRTAYGAGTPKKEYHRKEDIKMLFDYLTTYHYGRCVKNREWYLLKTIGINRLYYIHSGEVSVLLDKKLYTLRQGHLYLLPQNLKFELLLTEHTRVDHTFLDFFTLPAIKMNSLIDFVPAQHPLISQAAQILLTLTGQYQTYPSMERNDYSDLVESYLDNLLFLIDREHPISTIKDPRINTVLDYIHKHYAEQITLEHLLEITHLEKNYFIRLFKSTMNITPYQYIKKYRFNIALTLLKHRCTLNEAAQAIGYTDAVSFSHAFKKTYGVPPSVIAERSDGQR